MQSTDVLGRDERAFLASARRAVLGTVDPFGRPRLVPICFVLADDDVGRPILHVPLDAKPKRVTDPLQLARVRDILARPAVTVLVDRWSEDWSRLGWLRVRGTAEIVLPAPASRGPERTAAIVALRAKYPQYATHDLETRPLIRIAVDDVLGWGELRGSR